MATQSSNKTKATTKKAPTKKSSPVRSANAKTATKRKTNTPTKRANSAPRTSKTSRSPKSNAGAQSTPLSVQQKADIIGIVLIVIGLLSLLAALTSQSGQLTRWWTNLLQSWVGWGAYALPLILLALGAWFLLSRVEQLPKVNLERVIGVVHVFFNLLVWFELIDISFPPVGSPSGGGLVGGTIYQYFETGLGKAGTVIVLIAWFLIALMLLVDLC